MIGGSLIGCLIRSRVRCLIRWCRLIKSLIRCLIGGLCLIRCLVTCSRRVYRGVARLRAIGDVCCLIHWGRSICSRILFGRGRRRGRCLVEDHSSGAVND